jgi:hypothetical protein
VASFAAGHAAVLAETGDFATAGPRVAASGSLDLNGALYVDCGATNSHLDAIGRLWESDASYLVSTGAFTASFPGRHIDDSLLGDQFLPNEMLNTERWFNTDIVYRVAAPNGTYSVIVYFSENWIDCVGPTLGGTGCSNCARLFDVQVQSQRVDAYNAADAALPPAGDGLGTLYKATQLTFVVPVTSGVITIAIIDRGDGDPPEDASIKGFTILKWPAGTPVVQPRIAHVDVGQSQVDVLVDLLENLPRFLSGDLPPLRLQASQTMKEWATLSNLPQPSATGATFLLPPTIHESYRAVIGTP